MTVKMIPTTNIKKGIKEFLIEQQSSPFGRRISTKYPNGYSQGPTLGMVTIGKTNPLYSKMKAESP